MKFKIFYQLKGTMFRSKGNETNLIEIDEIFKDENPIIAREKAFDKYKNYIDVFLQGKGKQYISHEETIKELQDFTNSFKSDYAKVGTIILGEIDVDFDKGLSIYLVKSNKTFQTLEGETIYEDKELIHYIDNQFNEFKKIVFSNLVDEYSIYAINNFERKNYRKDINIANLFDEEELKSILETPIDFTSYFL